LKTESTELTDEQDGSWEPFAKIVEFEGNDKSAFTAAENYVSKCFELHGKGETLSGRPWVLYNDFTHRVEMLYVKKRFRSAHREQWLLQSESEKVDGGTAPIKGSGKAPGQGSGSAQGSICGGAAANGSETAGNLSSCMK